MPDFESVAFFPGKRLECRLPAAVYLSALGRIWQLVLPIFHCRNRTRWSPISPPAAPGVTRPEIATQRRPSPAKSPLLGVDRTWRGGGWDGEL